MAPSNEASTQGKDISAPDVNGWLLSPVGTLVEFITKEMIISGVTHRALIGSQIIPELLQIAMIATPKESLPQIQSLINASMSDRLFAKEEIETGFNTICSHHAIATWAAVETTIENTLVNLISKLPSSPELIQKASPTINAKKIRRSTAIEVRKSIRIWENALTQDNAIDRAIFIARGVRFSRQHQD